MNLRSCMLAALVVAGCAPTSPSGTVGPTASPAGLAPSPAAATASPSTEARIPVVSGPPVALEPGTYLSPEGFAPVISITVPEGWFGSGSAADFAAGQGLDEVNQRFADAGLYVNTIDMAYDAAAVAFGALDGVTVDQPPTTQAIGGHDSTTFYVHAEDGQVILDPIAPGVDVNEATAQVMFIDVDGTTVMIRTELFDDSGAEPLDGVIASIEFP